MKKLQLSLFLSLISCSIFSQMRVIDPQQNQWWSSEASIENVHIEMKPTGLFCETSITFEVKASDSYFDNESQLEYIYDFSMPENVVFNDSWLWIEDYISEGQIYEQSAGTAIYESIVDRQQDPSILTKYYNDTYNFRIYPLFNDSTRKVKLSYLVPFNNKNNSLESFLPITFLTDSYYRPQNVTLDITDDMNWFHSPVSSSYWTVTNTNNNTTTYTLKNDVNITNQNVAFSSDSQDKYKLGVYEGDESNYFQLMYMPEVEQSTTPTYNLFLLDHENDNSYYDIDKILPIISESLNDLNEIDKFNILYHDFTSNFTSLDWQDAHPSLIEDAINKVADANTTPLSWLGTLLPEALSYIEESGQKARIIILSADNNFYDEDSSKDFLSAINNYVTQMDTEVSFSVVDYSRYRPSTWIGNQNYNGNQYLYENLVQQYDGIYRVALSPDYMQSSLQEIFFNEIDYISEYDLDIENDFGFSYAKFFNGTAQKLRLDQPIMMIGKYIGESPFRLEFNAIHEGTVYQENITMVPNMELNEKTVETWASQYILNNENEPDHSVVENVIDVSMNMGLLSKHTVFLCLERDTSSISSNNDDEDDLWTVDTEEIEKDESHILAYPNPFSDLINIEIPDEIISENKEFVAQILSFDGKLVHTFDQKTKTTNGKILLQWTPDNNLNGGIYTIRIITDAGVNTMKVMFLK